MDPITGAPENPLLTQLRQQMRQPPQPDTPPPALMPPPGMESGAPPIMQSQQPNVTDRHFNLANAAPRGSLLGEQQKRSQEVASGSGAGQVYGNITNSHFGQNHPLAGKLLGGLAQGAASAGDILGSSLAGVAPQLVPLVQSIPGTTMHHNELVRRSDQNINQMQGEQNKEADTAEKNARANSLNEPNLSPLATEEGYQSFDPKTGQAKALTNESGQQLNPVDKPGAITHTTLADGSVVALSRGPDGKITADEVFKGEPKPEPDRNLQQVTTVGPDGKPHTYGVDTSGNKVVDYGVHYEKPNVTNVNMGEKTFEYSDKQLETLAKPLRERSDRIERLRVTLSQGNPQADALIGPELLTAMAGGQGSGLRMNEAEIARIVGGRSQWENLKANMQHWSTNPQDARSITPEQDAMIRKLVEVINDKVQRKMTILNDAGSKIVDIQDPKQQHKLIADTRRALQQEDAEQGGGTGGTQSFTDNGKTYNIPAEHIAEFKKDHPNAR